jgi:hypothetical protein
MKARWGTSYFEAWLGEVRVGVTYDWDDESGRSLNSVCLADGRDVTASLAAKTIDDLWDQLDALAAEERKWA